MTTSTSVTAGAVTEIEIFDDAAVKVVDTPECREFIERVAKAAEENAVGAAPVRTGAYQASIGSGLLEGQSGPAAELYSDGSVDYWEFLEFGSIHNIAFRTLTNAVAQAVGSIEPT